MRQVAKIMKTNHLKGKLRKTLWGLLRGASVFLILAAASLSLSIMQQNEYQPVIDQLHEENAALNKKLTSLYSYLNGEAGFSIDERYEGDSIYEEIIMLEQIHTMQERQMPRILPLEWENMIYVSSWFGYRPHPVYKVYTFHEGIDYVAKVWTPVYCTADGVVTEVKRRMYGYGWYVKVDHGNGYETLYAHLSYIPVKIGQYVTVGQLIGRVGSTGLSTGPHLHYEVRYGGSATNPANLQDFNIINKGYQELVTLANGRADEV